MTTLIRYLLVFMRLLLGAWMLLNGLNHFVDVFPQPMGHTQLAGELMVSLIETGLFGLVKATEIVIGVCLLFDCFVPLALVMSLPISMVIWYNRVFLDGRGIDFSMGNGCLAFTVVLMVAYVRYYQPMMSWRAEMGRAADLLRLREILETPASVAPESRHRVLIAAAAVVLTSFLYLRIHPTHELPPGAGKTPAVIVREYLQVAYSQGRRREAQERYFSAEAAKRTPEAFFAQDGAAVADTLIDVVAQGHKVVARHRLKESAMADFVEVVEYFETDRAGTIVSHSILYARPVP